MVCAPGPNLGKPRVASGDAFAFSSDADAAARVFGNAASLWTAPWKAWWAVAFEALDPANYRR